MPYSDMPGKVTQGVLAENIGHPSHAGMHTNSPAISSSDTGAFLTAVL